MNERLVSLLLSAAVLLACSSGGLVVNGNLDGGVIGTGATEGGTQCGAKSRFFNGECRATCSATTRCKADENCVEIDKQPDGAVCLPVVDSTQCAYLGDDSQCVASGGFFQYSRGGGATFVPYLSTPGANPNDVTGHGDPYFYGTSAYGASGPCDGNADWVAVSAAGPVACNKRHAVTRCRLQYDRCVLIQGTTQEFVQP